MGNELKKVQSSEKGLVGLTLSDEKVPLKDDSKPLSLLSIDSEPHDMGWHKKSLEKKKQRLLASSDKYYKFGELRFVGEPPLYNMVFLHFSEYELDRDRIN